MLAIISPSKSQDFSNCKYDIFSHTRQIDKSRELINILQKKNTNEISKLMSISDKLAQLNFNRFQNFNTPFNLDNAKQAILAFKGDVYNGIKADSFNADDLAFIQNKVRILSGLYGVIRPLDLIQPYRLEMGVKLANKNNKNLYEFWNSDLTKILNKDEDNVIVNLASKEYFKSINKKILKAKIINIAFKEKKNDSYKIIAIFAKRARGMMINYIVRNKINKPEKLKKFSDAGYQFNQKFSDDTQWVFTRQ